MLVCVREGLSVFLETTNVSNFYILTALLEPLLNVDFHVEDLLLHGRIPVILDSIISATFQVGSDDSPLVFEPTVQDVKDELLFVTPLILLDLGIQMVVPALTALLTDTPRQIASNVCPLHRTCGLHER